MNHAAPRQVVRNGLGDRAGTCIDPKTQIVEGDFFVRSGPGTVKLPTDSAKDPGWRGTLDCPHPRSGTRAWAVRIPEAISRQLRGQIGLPIGCLPVSLRTENSPRCCQRKKP